MTSRLAQLLIFGLFIIHFAQSMSILNVTSANKILCHSCKGNSCAHIKDDNDYILACTKHSHLCWAGFVNKKPYRTCANRYCTPSGISLDNEIRNELCCRSNLCNSIPLNWTEVDGGATKNLNESSKLSAITTPAPSSSAAPTTTTSTTPAVHILDEIVNENRRLSSNGDAIEDRDDDSLANKGFSKGRYPWDAIIDWDRVPYDTAFGNRAVSISKLLILIMPIFLVLLL